MNLQKVRRLAKTEKESCSYLNEKYLKRENRPGIEVNRKICKGVRFQNVVIEMGELSWFSLSETNA